MFLVLDDEEANRDLLAARLAELGHDSLVAASGREALESLRPDVDLVLLDIIMPDLDGFEVARRIRAMPLYADLPIVMVTALSSKEDRLKAVEAGANDLITKPIDKLELRVRTTSLLQIKEAQDANKELLGGTLRGPSRS
jgi:putative two-component system response regulator